MLITIKNELEEAQAISRLAKATKLYKKARFNDLQSELDLWDDVGIDLTSEGKIDKMKIYIALTDIAKDGKTQGFIIDAQEGYFINVLKPGTKAKSIKKMTEKLNNEGSL